MDAELLDGLEDPLSERDASGETDDANMAAIALSNEPPFRITKGKYKGLILPRMLGVKPSLLDKVKVLRREIEADPNYKRHATVLAGAYADLRREAEEKAEELAEIKVRLATVMMMMTDQFEVEGDITSMTVGHGDRINTHYEPHLIVEEKEVFRLWCLKQGLERDMVLPWAKANKLLKEIKLAGEPNPPGGQCYARPNVRFTKGGG